MFRSLEVQTSQPFNLSTSQPFNLSTSQPLNLSTSQPLNLSTSQPFNLSTSQPFNLSTSQPLNLSTKNMGTHKDLDIWKLSMDFVVDIYKITNKFPNEEKFGLVNQMRRAAVSIPSNIAEGAGRKSHKENIQFLYIALGSLTELDTQLIIVNRLNYHDTSELLEDLNTIKAKLISFIKYIKSMN